jgi:long-chain fatty acid transport protein
MVMIGGRMDAGASLFSPVRSYTSTGSATTGVPDGAGCVATYGGPCPFSVGPQSIDSENEFFIIPHFGYNQMLDSTSSFGVSIYGNGGMNTEYEGGTARHDDGSAFPAPGNLTTTPGTFGAGTAGVDLSQLFITPTYASKLGQNSAWGVSAILAYQRFKATGLGTFAGFSVDSSNLSDVGYDSSTGFGVKVGWQGEVSPGFSLGASYQSKVKMGKFDKYKGLFAEGGDFDIPSTATVGLAYKPNSSSAVVLDVQRINYTDVAAVSNPIAGLLSGCATGLDASQCLGGANGAGFGWEDITIIKLGYQWDSSPDWTWRVGYSDGDQPIPSSETMFNILAPGVMEKHVTFGFTKKMGKTNEFTFASMYAPEKKVSGTNPLDPFQTIELKMKQYELAASWGWKF